MDKILGIDSAYSEAIKSRGRSMLISANLVAEMVDKIRMLEVGLAEALQWMDKDALPLDKREWLSALIYNASDKARESEPLFYAKELALYLENNIGAKYSCLQDDLADFITDMEK